VLVLRRLEVVLGKTGDLMDVSGNRGMLQNRRRYFWLRRGQLQLHKCWSWWKESSSNDYPKIALHVEGSPDVHFRDIISQSIAPVYCSGLAHLYHKA
jgi:hypothetical protein